MVRITYTKDGKETVIECTPQESVDWANKRCKICDRLLSHKTISGYCISHVQKGKLNSGKMLHLFSIPNNATLLKQRVCPSDNNIKRGMKDER
jgi:hypothetical protein